MCIITRPMKSKSYGLFPLNKDNEKEKDYYPTKDLADYLFLP